LPSNFNCRSRQLATALPQKFKQGIGIIIIRIFFATCFAHLAGPIVMTITSHDDFCVKKNFFFANMRKEKRLRVMVIGA
jgi:hypothetical protein